MKRAAPLAAMLALAFCAHAADKPCAPAEAAKAEKSIDNVVTWAQMHKAYLDYSHCNTGAVAEVYADALLRLIVQWKTIETLAGAMQKDEKYRDFVHAHLKSPAAKDDRETIYLRAKQACPKGLDAFCAALSDVVNPPAPPPATAPATPAK